MKNMNKGFFLAFATLFTIMMVACTPNATCNNNASSNNKKATCCKNGSSKSSCTQKGCESCYDCCCSGNGHPN